MRNGSKRELLLVSLAVVLLATLLLQYLCGEIIGSREEPATKPLVVAPSFFRVRSPAAFAKAVNHYVAMGESAAIQELKYLSAGDPERACLICQVLFDGNGGKPLRGAGLGCYMQPWNTMPAKDWPLFPLMKSGSSFFVYGGICFASGVPEEPDEYIDYCRREGVFRTQPLPVPTRDEAIRDAAALRESVAWKAIRWVDSSGLYPSMRDQTWSYEMSEEGEWKEILQQVEACR